MVFNNYHAKEMQRMPIKFLKFTLAIMTVLMLVAMGSNAHALCANDHILDLVSDGPGSITREAEGIGGECTTRDSKLYCCGDFMLKPVSNSNAEFVNWTGDCLYFTDNGKICHVSVTNEDISVTAHFITSTYPLTIGAGGDGKGAVTSRDGSISCSPPCTVTVQHDKTVTLDASGDSNSTFTGWGGACSGNGACSVTMNGEKTVIANFDTNKLKVSKTPINLGDGTVTSSPTGINCGSTCSAGYKLMQDVVLTATPDEFSGFTGWGGACSGNGTCTVKMDGDKTVTATFVSYTLNVSKSGAGTVASSPAGINCGGGCQHRYAPGKSVTLTATPSANYRFSNWSGACSGTGTCTVTMNGDKTVTATFVKVYQLTVSKAGTGTGTVTSSPAGINCGSTCSAGFAADSSVILTATPGTNSVFYAWGGVCTGTTDTCTVTMNSAKNATAVFMDLSWLPGILNFIIGN